jgi:hypothetical protein
MTEDLIQSPDGAGQLMRQELGGPLALRADTAIQAYVAIEGEKQRAIVQARQAIAKSFPRDYDEVRVRLLRDGARPAFAAIALYRKPVGNRSIVGFSIEVARCIARYYKNLDVSRKVVGDNSEERRVLCEVYDLEDNVSYAKEIVVPKTVERSTVKPGQEIIRSRINSQGQATYLVAATEDDLAIKQAALESKVMRNLYLDLLGADVKEELREKIEETLRNQAAKDPDTERKRLVDAFAAQGVQPADLKAYLGHELDKIGPQQIVDLRAIYAGIRDKETTWPEVMATRVEQRTAQTEAPAKTLDDVMKRKEQQP